MNINDLIFIHIPKNGGSSITNSLNEHGYITRYGHGTAHEIIQLIGGEEFDKKFKFCVVRNSWDRLLSVYNFMKHGSEYVHVNVLPEAQTLRNLHIHTFDEFVWFLYFNFKKQGFPFMITRPNKFYMVNNGTYEYASNENQMVRPQSHFIFDENGKTLINYVGKLDNLPKVIEELSTITNIDFNIPKRVNVTNKRTDREKMSNKSMKLITEMYELDINNFGFKFER